jgi:adenine phosphoribosyltransferase
VKDYLELVDTNTPGPRYDVTPLFADGEALAALVSDICAYFPSDSFDVAAGIDALGFVLGAALAARCEKGFIAIRKGGKLPVATKSRQLVDYSGHEKSLEIRTDAIKPGSRVLLVDEWVETGAQVSAAIDLIESQGGVVAGIATINIDENEKTRQIQARYRCFQVWEE